MCAAVWDSVGQISEEVAQEALLELVSATRCYGTTAAREMDIYRIMPSCALHVRQPNTHWPLHTGATQPPPPNRGQAPKFSRIFDTLWSVDSQKNQNVSCHQMSDFKDKMHQI